MKYAIDETNNTISFYRGDNRIVIANITDKAEETINFSIPWSEAIESTELKKIDSVRMLNKTQGILLLEDDHDERTQYAEDDQEEEEDESDQRAEEDVKEERNPSLSRSLTLSHTNQRRFSALKMNEQQKSLIISLINNDERQVQLEIQYLESVRDLFDFDIKTEDLPVADLKLQDVELDTGACKRVLEGKYSLGNKLRSAAIYDCGSLIQSAKRLNRAIEACEDVVKRADYRTVSDEQRRLLMRDLTRHIRSSAWKLVDAVNLSSSIFDGTIAEAQRKLGLSGFIQLADSIINQRYAYRNAIDYRLYRSTPMEDTMDEIRSEVKTAYEVTMLPFSIPQNNYKWKGLSLERQHELEMESLL